MRSTEHMQITWLRSDPPAPLHLRRGVALAVDIGSAALQGRAPGRFPSMSRGAQREVAQAPFRVCLGGAWPASFAGAVEPLSQRTRRER